MTPAGYMYKAVSAKPDWLKSAQVEDICSVSGCVSKDFAEWINYWKHNGYWLFDSPEIIHALAKEKGIEISEMLLFYYEVFEEQWDDEANCWVNYEPEKTFATSINIPQKAVLLGFDVVSYSAQNSAECSPLSCNHMAETIPVNKHCLLQSFDEAKRLVESGRFNGCEPGPYRIFSVYQIENA